MKRLIPWLLVMSRIVLAPVAIWLAIVHASNLAWMGQFAFAALSDWLDGKLARRWGTSTAGLRQADSIADTVYVLAVAISLWCSHPAIVHVHRWGIGLVIALELLRYPLDWWRFGRGASYHAWSAKLFGISLLIAVTAIMVFDTAGPFLWIALLIGVISELEGMWMSLVLPRWTHDVKGIKAAFAIRACERDLDLACKTSAPFSSGWIQCRVESRSSCTLGNGAFGADTDDMEALCSSKRCSVLSLLWHCSLPQDCPA